MRKIINGRMYDTETAQFLAEWEAHKHNFNWVRERLYRKKTGEYFLHGEGGPASCWGQQVDNNSYTGGEDIVPMSEANARAWAEKHLDADTYIQIFGPVEE